MGALLTRQEAAERLGVSVETMDRERKAGYLAYLQRKPGGKVLITEEAIADYLKRATHPAKTVTPFTGATLRKRRV